ncbi:MAG TPA: LiaF domain-containing protein [Gemmatimonadaceae bacterium]|nr:LiaF domain-containing protein [Gemmatimonadaceae bacterium]
MRNHAIVEQSSPVTGVVAFLGSTEREGHWELPRHLRALAVLGNVEIDLRNAVVGVGLYEIEAVAVFGNVEITVPPEINVECDGDALLGAFTVQYEGRVNTAAATRDSTIRVTGSAYAAAVTVRVKGPDEGVLAKLGRNLGFKRIDR